MFFSRVRSFWKYVVQAVAIALLISWIQGNFAVAFQVRSPSSNPSAIVLLEFESAFAQRAVGNRLPKINVRSMTGVVYNSAVRSRSVP